MNKSKDTLKDETEELPSTIKEILNFIESVFNIKNQIKTGQSVYSNILQKFSGESDSGFESNQNEESYKVPSKAILYCLENGDIKNILEECLEKLFRFMQNSKIYKYSLDQIESCKNIILKLIKHLEENDILENIQSVCKTFLESLWESFEEENDLLQFQYILGFFKSIANLHFLHEIVFVILSQKLLKITQKMKIKQYDAALTFLGEDDYICNSIMLLQIKLRHSPYLQSQELDENIFEAMGILEEAANFFSLHYLNHQMYKTSS